MRLKVGYFGDGPWAHVALEKILADSSVKVCFVCLRYDTQDEVLRKMAKGRSVDCFAHSNVNSDEFMEEIDAYKCDLFISMSFNQIFKKSIIDMPPMKMINCHAGKLPFYRGRNILNWVLINDEDEFGVTVHYVDEGIDTGDIILQRVFPISDDDDYASLLHCAHNECANVLYDAIKNLQNGSVERVRQDEIHEVGFYCTQRCAGDERLDWRQSSRAVFNFVRAICKPGPCARTHLRDREMIINKVRMIPNAPEYKGVAGAIVGVSGGGLVVKTIDSTVLVTEYEYDGRVRIGDRLL